MPDNEGAAPVAPAMPTPAPGALEAVGQGSVTAMPSPGSALGEPTPPQTQPPGVSSDLETRIQTILDNAEQDQARRSGLDRQNREYDQRLGTIETQLTELGTLLRSGDAPAASPAETPPVSPEPTEPNPGNDALQALQAEVAELRAGRQAEQSARLRDALITEYTSAGQPGEGMDLNPFTALIPPVADGDDTAARAAMDSIVAGLRNVQGTAVQSTQDAMLQGVTPGSSPPAAVAGADAELAEFNALHTEINDTNAIKAMSPEAFAQKTARYDELLPIYGVQAVDGFTPPWGSLNDMNRQLSVLWADNQRMRQQMGGGEPPE